MQTVFMHVAAHHSQAGRFLLLLAAGSALALAAALVAQYGFLLHPCHLCLLQRYPHAAIVALGALGAGVKTHRLQRGLLLLCGGLAMAGAGIAGYHAGVEAGIFAAPGGCSSDSSGNESLEALRAAILQAPLVTCDQAMAHVLGLSLAAWSAAVYLFLTILAFSGYHRSTRLDITP